MTTNALPTVTVSQIKKYAADQYSAKYTRLFLRRAKPEWFAVPDDRTVVGLQASAQTMIEMLREAADDLEDTLDCLTEYTGDDSPAPDNLDARSELHERVEAVLMDLESIKMIATWDKRSPVMKAARAAQLTDRYASLLK